MLPKLLSEEDNSKALGIEKFWLNPLDYFVQQPSKAVKGACPEYYFEDLILLVG